MVTTVTRARKGAALSNDELDKNFTDLESAVNTAVQASAVGIVDGIASLGPTGKLKDSQIPEITITDTFVVASEVAMLALVAEKGDVAIRTDIQKTYILKVAGASVLANWQVLPTPLGGVSTVAGRGGDVVLTAADVGLGNVNNTPDANKPISTAQAAALALKAGIFGGNLTTGVLDWNDVSNTRPGYGPTLLLGTATNGPGSDAYFHVLNFEYASNNGTGNVTQMAISYTNNLMWMRHRYSGAWSSWTKFLSSADVINAATVTNGVYTVGDQIIAGVKTFTDHTYVQNSFNAASLVVRQTAANGTQRTLLAGQQSNGAARVILGIDSDERPVIWTYDTSGAYTGRIYLSAGKVSASGGFAGDLEGNATTATTAVNVSGNVTSAASTWNIGSTYGSSMQAMGNASYAGGMTFHRAGTYAINAGLDYDNVFRIGGYSDGSSVFRMHLDTAGNLTARGNVTGYSDLRLKRDLEPIRDALSKITSLTGYTFTRIDTEERQTGLIAQEVEAVLPEAVNKLNNGLLAVAYGNMAGLLVEAIKELDAKTSKYVELEKRLAKLEGKK